MKSPRKRYSTCVSRGIYCKAFQPQNVNPNRRLRIFLNREICEIRERNGFFACFAYFVVNLPSYISGAGRILEFGKFEQEDFQLAVILVLAEFRLLIAKFGDGQFEF